MDTSMKSMRLTDRIQTAGFPDEVKWPADLLVHLCCHCCATAQELRHVQHAGRMDLTTDGSFIPILRAPVGTRV